MGGELGVPFLGPQMALEGVLFLWEGGNSGGSKFVELSDCAIEVGAAPAVPAPFLISGHALVRWSGEAVGERAFLFALDDHDLVMVIGGFRLPENGDLPVAFELRELEAIVSECCGQGFHCRE
jgi:hypothetical protein